MNSYLVKMMKIVFLSVKLPSDDMLDFRRELVIFKSSFD